jgi:hypothetical protein
MSARDAVCDSPGGVPEHALLGNKGGNAASLEPRGFQRNDTFQEIDQETGEITRYRVDKKGRKIVVRTPQEHRAERYALKSVVNWLFPKSETAKCLRARIPTREVEILKDQEHNKAFYGGLRRCATVWQCPVCSSTISERRRVELKMAIATAKAMGMQVNFATYTFPHGMGDDLHKILVALLNARKRMVASRHYKDISKLLEIEGLIRALETTWGMVNGFNPHIHELIFASPKFTVPSFREALYPCWLDACRKEGLPAPSREHGVDVQDGEAAGDYASKWGLESEMVKGHSKTSKSEKGMTSYDFLRDYLKTGNKRSLGLFKVFVEAFKGRRQLCWSDGLKAKLGVSEVSDPELVGMETETAHHLAFVPMEAWKAVLATHTEAALLQVAESEPGAIPSFLSSVQTMFSSMQVVTV